MDAVRRSRWFPMRGHLAALAVIVVVDIALVRAHHAPPNVNVVTITPSAVGPHVASSRGGGAFAPLAIGTGATGPVTDGSCPSAAPDSTWTCKNGSWTPPSGVGMGAPHLGACAGASPSPSFVCENGMWTLPASGSSGAGASTSGVTGTGVAPTSATTNASASAAAITSPTGTDAATAGAGAPVTASEVAPRTPGAPSSNPPQLPGGGPACAGQLPSVVWTCRNGVWVPGG